MIINNLKRNVVECQRLRIAPYIRKRVQRYYFFPNWQNISLKIWHLIFILLFWLNKLYHIRRI